MIWGGREDWENWEKAICEEGDREFGNWYKGMLVCWLLEAY